MTDAQFNLLLGYLPVILASLGSMVVSIITARRVQAASAKIDETAIEVQKVKEIANGHSSVALKSNAALTAVIETIRGLPGDVKAAADAKAVYENQQAGKVNPPTK